MLILLHFSFLIFLNWRLYQFYQHSPLRLYYWPALALKLVAGVAMGMLYFFYYGSGDTLVYHHDAAELAQLALNNFPAYLDALTGTYPQGMDLVYLNQERALLTAKVFSLFYIPTGSNYWLTACYISFLAFISLFSLAHRLALYCCTLPRLAALAFLFWPSFVFWTSGLLKESLAMVCISFAVATFLPYIMSDKKVRLPEVGVSLLLLFFLFQIKYYYAGLLVPVLFCLVFAKWAGRHFRLKEYQVWLVFLFCLVAGVGVATRIHPNLYASRFLEVWVENYFIVSGASPEGGFVVYENLEADWGQILKVSPRAIFTGLFEPLFLFRTGNMLRMLASAENWLLFLLTVPAAAGWLLNMRGRISLSVFAVLLYILAFALIMGIAAPNFGALVRYRISYQPFFVLLLLEGILQLFRWLRKREKQIA